MRARIQSVPVTGSALGGCRFFDDLDAAERDAMATLMTGLRVARGVELLRHGENSDEVYFVVAGVVEVSNLTREGREVSFDLLQSGEMFGELSALDGEPRSAGVIAETDVTVLRMPGEIFREKVTHDPRLARRVQRRLCGLARVLCEKAFEARALDVPGRIRREIHRTLRAAGARGDGFVLDPAPSQDDLGRRVGTNRHQVNRVIAELRHRALIVTRRRVWKIPDPEALFIHLREQVHGDPDAGPKV